MAVSPAIRNFKIQRASDFTEEYVLSTTQTDGSELAMDLVGYSIDAEAWDYDRECKYADFSVTSTADNRAVGKFFLTLTDEQTLNFPDELYVNSYSLKSCLVKHFGHQKRNRNVTQFSVLGC